MALTKYKLGDFIECSTANNRMEEYGHQLIRGVNTEGVLTNPKVDVKNVDLKPYKIVRKNAFVYNPSRLNLGSIARCEEEMCIVSHLYIVFYLTRDGLKRIDPKWLYIYMRRNEFYREVSFRNFGSQRPEFNFKKLSDLEIPLPPLEIQRKYVAIYEAMCENQRCYEASLEDLKLACDAELEGLMDSMPPASIEAFVNETDERNEGQYDLSNVRGISIEKKFIPTKAKMEGVSLSNYKVVHPRAIAYVPVTSRNGGKITIAQNTTKDTFLISAAYLTMKCDEMILLPEYLMLFFTRSEFDRYARFNSWGSARETFDWAEMKNVKIPIPPLDVQRSIADLFKAYNERKEINEKLKQQIRDLCPILIKGSLGEASKA